VALDEADPAHVRSEVVHMINLARSLQALRPAAKVQELEFVRGGLPVLGHFPVHTTNPIPTVHQVLGEVVPDETTRARHQHSLLANHLRSNHLSPIRPNKITRVS